MKAYYRIRKKTCRFMRRYINGTKGMISLFLAILMLPFVSVAGALINAARVDSAIAVFDEALCNASNSTLGTYDSFLRTRFGLLAMSQNTSSHGGGYTVQDLISETFEFYMQQNTAVLSNTYFNVETDAAGIYPLADTNVLLSEVLEYGKYAIPAQLVIDGLCLEDMIASLSKNMGMAKSVIGSFTSAGTLTQKIDNCESKFDDAGEKLDTYAEKKKEYSNAYTAFKTAAEDYNALIDEMIQKIAECEEAIEKSEEEYKELESGVHTQKELENAQEEMETAAQDLEDIIEKYQAKLDVQRGTVENSKAAYITAIEAFASAAQSAGNAVVGAQNAYNELKGAGAELVTNVANTVYEGQKQSIENQIKDMKDSQAAAAERGDNTAAYLWGDQMDEARARQDAISNENTVAVKAASAAETAARGALNQFAVEAYADEFNQIYGTLMELKVESDAYTIESDYETQMSDTSQCYDSSIVDPLTNAQVEQLLEDLAKDVMKSSFFSTAKALIGFIKAMFTFSAWVDPELTASIDPAVYAGIGGLPSGKDRSAGSPYSLTSEYDTADSQKSAYYKQLLNSYSGGTAIPGNGPEAGSVIEQIVEDVSALSECFSGWFWGNIFSKLKALVSTLMNLVGHLLAFIGNAVTLLTEAMGSKLLLAGYVAYNIPNRTTYKGSALTGGAYKLPNAGSSLQGYAFYGAETEYIMKGSLSEAENQSRVFNNVWFIRLFFDIAFVLTNAEVASIAGEAGAATFGIGTAVVYILYIVAEPFVDTLVLVNGGTVPIWKSKIYLTPSGITDLIGKFVKLKLTEDQKNTAYKTVVEVMGAGQVSESYAQNFADAYQSGIKDPEIGKEPDILNSLTFDYTKTLLLAMLFENKEKMLGRLADVIQMEASYYAASPSLNGIGTYAFNLDESYTYLRSSGSFTTNEFLPISDRTGIRSKERIIYRGY